MPCLSWTSGSLTFTKGVLTGAIPWDLLEKQYASRNAYKEEVVRLIEFEESAHKAGVDFAQTMDRIAQLNSSKNLQVKAEAHPPSVRMIQDELVADSLDPFKNQRAQKKPTQYVPTLYKSITDTMTSSLPELPKDYQQMLPKIIRNDVGKESQGQDGLHREAVHFMRGIMDECTHLKNYDMPLDPALINIVVAEYDAYQPRDQFTALPDIWPGSSIRYIPGRGHVSSYLFSQHEFRKAIYDTIETYVEKYMQKSV